MAHFSIDAPPAITDEVRELQEDAGTDRRRLADAGGGRPHDHGRPLRRTLEGDQGRAGPGSPSTPALCTSSIRKRVSASTTEPKEKEHRNDEATLHSARAARRRARVPRRRLRRRRRRGRRDRRRHDRGRGRRSVSGNISVLAVWTGAEGEAFQAVLDGFKEENPDVTVSYKSAAEPATVLSTAVEGGNPPDIAALPQPGFMTDFAQRGALKPIDFARGRDQGGLLASRGSTSARSTASSTASSSRAPTSRPSGTTSPLSRTQASSRRRTGTTSSRPATRLKASGVPPYSIGGADGWTLTDLFENIYLRTGRSGEVRPADEARDPVDRSVGEGGADGDGQGAPVRQRSPAAPRARSRRTSRPR